MYDYTSKIHDKPHHIGLIDTFSAPNRIRTGHCVRSLKLLALHKCNNCLKNVSKPLCKHSSIPVSALSLFLLRYAPDRNQTKQKICFANCKKFKNNKIRIKYIDFYKKKALICVSRL